MNFTHILKPAAAVLLATGLAGCFDIDMDVAVLGPDTAEVTITSTMSKDMQSMMQMSDEDSGFCGDDSVVTETEETVTCVETKRGTFAEVFEEEGASSDEPQPTIETVAPGQVKVTFPTSTMGEDMGLGEGGEEADAQAKAMMSQLFAGHSITMRVSGARVIESNMEISADGKSAQLVVPFMDLIEDKVSFEQDSYAIVQVP